MTMCGVGQVRRSPLRVHSPLIQGDADVAPIDDDHVHPADPVATSDDDDEEKKSPAAPAHPADEAANALDLQLYPRGDPERDIVTVIV